MAYHTPALDAAIDIVERRLRKKMVAELDRMFGYPVKVDRTVSEGEVRLEVDGEVVGRIVGLKEE